MSIPSIILKPGRQRSILGRHPWLFLGAIAHMPKGVAPGDIVAILSHEGTTLGFAHWCGGQSLVCRIFSFADRAHFDEHFWRTRFQEALDLRLSLAILQTNTTGYRLIHAEGDGLPGLICDIFDQSASVQISNPGMAKVMPTLAAWLQEQLHISQLYVEDSFAHQSDFYFGQNPVARFFEHGMTFEAKLRAGQKTGHFLDQRDNRLLLAHYAKKRHILDCFCYSGGFSTYGFFGGATRVTSVDISEQAIDLCKRHVEINQFPSSHHKTVVADCFSYLRQIKQNDFDLIVLDPPAFAKSKNAVGRAARGYKDINLLALKALSPRGLLFTFSCSQHISKDLFQKIIFAAAKDAGRSVRIIHELSQGPDHPVNVYCPETAYLKGLVLYVN